ncbi:MAG: type II secretion system F family protein [Pirellulales bacterium]
MMSILIPLAAFIGVAALICGMALLVRGRTEEAMDTRLAQLTGKGGPKDVATATSILADSLSQGKATLTDRIAKSLNLKLLISQADADLTPPKFVGLTGGFLLAGFLVGTFLKLHPGVCLLISAACGVLPLFWLKFKRARRFKAFGKQLPDALELIARALRSGHSIGAGFHLVADEMNEPIAGEFTKVFEEQNLGIPMEDALNSMVDRIPNLDLKFFATAIILQRSTGGDLAEILDKIGDLIRERFKIWGQVQALTGEGRLSGIVLLALPPALFAAVYNLNPDYLMVLFTDPMGKQMLIGGVVMQLLGAVVIRKIVNIRV